MTVIQDKFRRMEEIEVVAFACRGTLLDWAGAVEAVAYELARRNGESPLDRGAALRRRVEALADGHGLARGFERLARERGYRGEESGEESLARVVAMARPLRGAREAVALAVRVRDDGWSPSPAARAPARCTCSAPRSRLSLPDLDPAPRRCAAGARALRHRLRAPPRRSARAGHARRRARRLADRSTRGDRGARARRRDLVPIELQRRWRPDERTRRHGRSRRPRRWSSRCARGSSTARSSPACASPSSSSRAEFGVARPTVRAAIQTLCHEGLLVREPNRSAHIPVLTREEILDLFSVRIPLECLVVRAVLERDVSLDGAREAIAGMEALPDDAGWSEVVAGDGAFHRALVRAVGSPAAGAPLRRAERRDPPLRRAAAPELGVAAGDRLEHHEVLEVLETRRRRRRRGPHDRAPRARGPRPHRTLAPLQAVARPARSRARARRARRRRGSRSSASASSGRGLLSIRRLMPTDASAMPRRSLWATPISASEAGRPICRPSAWTCSTGSPGCPSRVASSASSASRAGPVELHHVGQQQPGAEAVRGVGGGADRELQRVRGGDAGVAEGDAGEQAAVEHAGAGLEVVAVLDGAHEVARDVPGGGQRERVREQVLADLRAPEDELDGAAPRARPCRPRSRARARRCRSAR